MVSDLTKGSDEISAHAKRHIYYWDRIDVYEKEIYETRMGRALEIVLRVEGPIREDGTGETD